MSNDAGSQRILTGCFPGDVSGASMHRAVPDQSGDCRAMWIAGIAAPLIAFLIYRVHRKTQQTRAEDGHDRAGRREGDWYRWFHGD
jgi:hypothetical protein